MAKKSIDKEFLAKNQFWLLLGGALVLTLAGLAITFIGPRGKVKAAQKNYEEKLSTLTKKKDPKNDSFLTKWLEFKKKYEEYKELVWKQAFETQEDLSAWPPGMNAPAKTWFGSKDGIDPATKAGRDALTKYRENFYDKQFPKTIFEFLSQPGEQMLTSFPIQVPSDNYLNLVPKVAWDRNKGEPTVEEFWLAQEDLWVRRELLLTLKDALVGMGECQETRIRQLWVAGLAGGPLDAIGEVGGPLYSLVQQALTPPQGFVAHRQFQNRNWRLDIYLEQDKNGQLQVSPKSTITNINPAGRPLSLINAGDGIRFRLKREAGKDERKQTKYRYLDLKIQGTVKGVLTPLVPAGQSREFGEATTSQAEFFAKDFKVEQIFDFQTSPIRRVERLELGVAARDHRLARMKMLPAKTNPNPTPKSTEGDTSQSGQGGQNSSYTPPVNTGGGPPGPMGGPAGPAGGPAGTAPADATPNGIDRNRYVLSNDQVRRIPVCLVVVIDQAYRNEFLIALANSRLRFQTTQAYWRRIPPEKTGALEGYSGYFGGMVPPGEYEGSSGGIRIGDTSGPIGYRGSFSVPKGPMSTGGPPTGGPPMGGLPTGMPPTGMEDPTTTQSLGSESSLNLVEITVHGLVSLYERPGRPAETPKNESPSK